MTQAPSGATGTTPRVQPESFRARALAVSLSVKNLKASLEWYHEVLRFHIAQLHERDGTLRAVSLKAGAVQILLAQDDGAKGADRVKGQGFSIQFTTAQDIDELAKGIKERGGKLETEPADMYGARVFRVRDPDGFMLVISSERPG